MKLTHPTNRPNFSKLFLNGYTLYFSYETIVAFHNGETLIVTENTWGPTTAKHINYAKRLEESVLTVPHEELLDLVYHATSPH